MAVRFAGDFFGIPLVEQAEDRSALVQYFPELATRFQKPKAASGEEQNEARSFRGAKAVTPFTGFKTLEKSTKQMQTAAPVFAGFKSGGQPT